MTIQTIPLNKITPPAVNPRRAIDPPALEGVRVTFNRKSIES